MSIESTITVEKTEALIILTEKGIKVYKDDSLDRLSDLLYENRDTIFENYLVVPDDYKESCWMCGIVTSKTGGCINYEDCPNKPK